MKLYPEGALGDPLFDGDLPVREAFDGVTRDEIAALRVEPFEHRPSERHLLAHDEAVHGRLATVRQSRIQLDDGPARSPPVDDTARDDRLDETPESLLEVETIASYSLEYLGDNFLAKVTAVFGRDAEGPEREDPVDTVTDLTRRQFIARRKATRNGFVATRKGAASRVTAEWRSRHVSAEF